MKMREVCEKTGLTERTVRYYMERGLVRPDAFLSESGRRTDYRFHEEDIQDLRDAALLRDYGFSIDAILEMKQTPACIGEQIRAQAESIRTQEAALRGKQEILNGLGQTELSGIAQLAESLRREQRRLSLPDLEVSPDFRRLDGPEKTEPEEDFAALERELRRQGRKKALVLWGIGVLLALAVAAGLAVRRAGQKVYAYFTPIASATFSEKWQEEGGYFARLSFEKGSGLEEISCVVRFEDFPLYWAIVPGHEYMGITLCMEVPLNQGKKEGLVNQDNTVDPWVFLRDDALSARYVTVQTVQGE